MPQLCSLAEFKQRFEHLGNPDLTVDYSTYTKMSCKCRFIDREFGEWWAKPTSVLVLHQTHPKRKWSKSVDKRRLSLEEVEQRLSEVHHGQISIDKSTYVSCACKAKFVDAEFGEWWAVVSSVLSGKGNWARSYHVRQKQRKMPKDTIDQKLAEKHGGLISIDYSTFVSTHHNARFIHAQYGEWWTKPTHVLRGSSHPAEHFIKIKRTLRSKYGVDHAMQKEEFFRKAFSAHRKQVTLIHWKTKLPIACTASYEYSVIQRLNELKLDYDSQIKFQLSNSVYYCDLYVKDWNKYIEIKGYFRPHSKRKWEEFIAIHPNSELWTLKEVTEFTGKTAHYLAKDFKLAWHAEQKNMLDFTLQHVHD
jgi:hypothetical protein